MLRELIKILRSKNPLSAINDDFARMIKLTYEMTTTAGEFFFGKKVTPEERSRIYEQDVQVNKLERSIRKRVVAHLSLMSNIPDVPYCLLLMSVVKDVERLGDYAKNISELVDLRLEPLPDDDILQELREIRKGVEEAFQSTSEIFATSDHERALQYIRRGRDLAHRCDTLIQHIASAPCEGPTTPGTTTAQVLGVRYYKRIGGHVLNLLSSVVMPLHKVDYYDEDEIPAEHD